MEASIEPKLLRRAIARAGMYGDWFLVAPLTRYAKRAGLTEPELAGCLGVSLPTLHRLMLWQTPREQAEIAQIAERTGADPAWLTECLDYAVSGRRLPRDREASAASAALPDPAADSTTVATRAGTVLVVEDDPTLAKLVRELLEEAGLEVVVARDGEEALARYREQRPDCILLDALLPVSSGREVLETVRHEDDTTQIVVLTAIENAETRREWLRRGADDYLSKPCDAEDLLVRVQNRVAARRRLGELESQTGEAVRRVVAHYAQTIPHEFNQPLAVIIGYGELIQEPHVSPDQYREMANQMAVAGLELASLVAKFARLREHRVRHFAGVDMVELDPPTGATTPHSSEPQQVSESSA